jgi:hypothetical protein
MDGMCTECNYGHMEEGMGETCECGGTMYEGMCNECGSGYMEEETGHLDDIYHEEDLNPTAGFDYIEGSSNDVDTFEGMHKKLYKENDMDIRTSLERQRDMYDTDMDTRTSLERQRDMYDTGMDDSDFQDYESSYTEDGVEDPDNEDDGYEDINASEVTDGELDELDIADLVKGKRYKYNHPLHADEFEFDSEHKYPEGEDMYGFRNGKTGYSIPGKHVKDYVSHLDDEDDVVYEIELDEYDADDMDVSDVKPAYNFDSDGPGFGSAYPVNEYDDEEYDEKYEPMKSAWADELDEVDVSGSQGIYGDMDPAFDFDSNGPGIAGPYQHSSWGGGSENEDPGQNEFNLDLDEFDPRDKSWEEIKAHTNDDSDWDDVDEDLKESFLTQKKKISEMFNRFNKYN